MSVTVSYDITCKWSIHHLERFAQNHPDLDVGNFEFSYYVPKFHLPGHEKPCHTTYSFNYTRGVGRTHSETVEQEWAHINLAALSTRDGSQSTPSYPRRQLEQVELEEDIRNG